MKVTTPNRKGKVQESNDAVRPMGLTTSDPVWAQLLSMLAEPEFRHARISPDEVFEVKLEDIRPARKNNLVYRPPDPKDPALIAMAQEMRDPKIGQLTPITVTTDGVILSGHRRYAARKLAGLDTIKAVRFPIMSTDPRFDDLLVRFNNQREKNAAEIFREELVRLNPVDAHHRLVEHRVKSSRVPIETMTIEGRKTRARITKAKRPFLNAIIAALNSESDYWPLSDRRVHYLLLNDPPLKHASKPHSRYANDDKSYDSLTELITRARLVGWVPWEAIADPTRPVVTGDVHANVQGFIRRELDWFLKQYNRDLQRTQPLHIEIVGEKNTIQSVIDPVAREFSIPYTIGRGYASAPPRHAMVQRFKESGKGKLLILFLSDCDPEGDDIAHSFARSIRDDFNVRSVEAVKVALTREQVSDRNLPPCMLAKDGSSRRKKFVERHGEHVWELDALTPTDLQQILRQSIERVIDIDAFNTELEAERKDAAHLEAMRTAMKTVLVANFPELDLEDEEDEPEE